MGPDYEASEPPPRMYMHVRIVISKLFKKPHLTFWRTTEFGNPGREAGEPGPV
jgi:hypothetical protein